MAAGIIEINDAGIRVTADGELKLTSPGYAVLDGDRLMLGEEARRNARLLPRWTNNRFWNQLGTDPIAGATGSIRHHADLAFAHLESIWDTVKGEMEQAIFAVPGWYSREQLGLLLGMARESDIPVTGVVDVGVAAAASDAATTTVLWLDIYLHRITLTVLKVDSTLRRQETVTVAETGLFTLWDRWANIIASQFIQTSRYDPMHQADSEQRLYDTLPDWIAHRKESRTSTFELEVGNSVHQAAISQEQLLHACSTIYPQIVQLLRDHIPPGERATLLVSDRFRGFPGLRDSLALVNNADVIVLGADEIATGVSAHEDSIISANGTVSHTTTLPVSSTRQVHRTPAERRPSHVLSGNVALAIGQALRVGGIEDGEIVPSSDAPVCTIYVRGGETLLDVHHGKATVDVNGESVSGTVTLTLGDTISIDGKPMTLISATP